MTLDEEMALRDEIAAQIRQLDTDINNIRSQIEHAQARRIETGQCASPMWFAKANSALRYKNAEREAQQHELGKINRRIKDRRFMDIARRVLTEEQYIEIASQI
jgi:hypothetical protein